MNTSPSSLIDLQKLWSETLKIGEAYVVIEKGSISFRWRVDGDSPFTYAFKFDPSIWESAQIPAEVVIEDVARKAKLLFEQDKLAQHKQSLTEALDPDRKGVQDA